MRIKKYSIYYADLNPAKGSEQGGIRPVLVIQNDIGNLKSPTVIVSAITSKNKRMRLSTHVPIKLEEGILPKASIVMLEQIRTIDKERLIKYIGKIDQISANAVERASLFSLGIDIHKIYQRMYT